MGTFCFSRDNAQNKIGRICSGVLNSIVWWWDSSFHLDHRGFYTAMLDRAKAPIKFLSRSTLKTGFVFFPWKNMPDSDHALASTLLDRSVCPSCQIVLFIHHLECIWEVLGITFHIWRPLLFFEIKSIATFSFLLFSLLLSFCNSKQNQRKERETTANWISQRDNWDYWDKSHVKQPNIAKDIAWTNPATQKPDLPQTFSYWYWRYFNFPFETAYNIWPFSWVIVNLGRAVGRRVSTGVAD